VRCATRDLGKGGGLLGEQLLVAPPLADVYEGNHAPHQLTIALMLEG